MEKYSDQVNAMAGGKSFVSVPELFRGIIWLHPLTREAVQRFYLAENIPGLQRKRDLETIRLSFRLTK